jgi:chemotaxis regulatin CheY-phosphate phosphatase CheZ
VTIPHQTLSQWREKYADRYERVRADALPAIKAAAVEDHMAAAKQLIDLEVQMHERLQGKVDELEARDLAGGIRNLAVSAAVHRDKAALLQGEPTQIVENRLPDLRRALKEVGIDVVIDGEAEEITDAELAA